MSNVNSLPKVGIVCAVGQSKEGYTAFGNNDGSLPWGKPLKSDMEMFKAITTDYHVVVMGRKTFESLPGKLKGRFNIVLSSDTTKNIVAKNGEEPDDVYTNLDGFELRHPNTKYCVIGGANLIESTIKKESVKENYDFGIFLTTVMFTNFREYFEADIHLPIYKLLPKELKGYTWKEKVVINGNPWTRFNMYRYNKLLEFPDYYD